MSNEASPKCPQCGTSIKGDAPAGLCPGCLMALNLKTETVFTGDTSATQPPLPPEELAPHFPQLEILECLGRGGMGVVYKARQKSLNRFVALKLLAPERVTDAKFAERFTREAHALAALNHPHIVTVYDFGQAGGFYFLLMEFVDGVNLRQLLQAKKLTPEEALAVIPPLCDALQYAHEHGIVHRDIKPANLLLDKGGRVKIADFGIAKMVGDNSSIGLAESQPAGTPQYMAPEQKDHQRTDHRADIYSLGVVLYEMLTGELPADKLQPPSRKVQIDVRLDEIVLRALETKPEFRYQTAAEMRTQLETIALTQPTDLSAPAQAAPAFSRKAVVGACWAPLLFIALFLSKQPPGPPWWAVPIIVVLGLAGFAAPLGTTILGWMATAQIRRSAGQIYGLALAVFDGLFFPLLMLDGLIGWMTFTAWSLCVDFFANPAMQVDPAFGTRLANFIAHHHQIPILAAIVVALIADFLVIRRVWRAVSGAAPASSATSGGFARKVVLRAVGVLLLLLGVFIFVALVSLKSYRLSEVGQSAEALQQKLKQQNGKPDGGHNGPSAGTIGAQVTKGASTKFVSAIGILEQIPGAPAKWRIITAVSEADVASVKIGQDVTFTLDAIPQGMSLGKITQIGSMPITRQNSVTYEISIDVNESVDAGSKFKSGMTAIVVFIVEQRGSSHATAAPNMIEDEIIKVARERLNQTRQSYEAKQVSLSEVEEAEGELALAEARGDQLKRAEARLTIATKYLERIEIAHRSGNVGEAEYNQAKQRKLETQIEKTDALRNLGRIAAGRNTEDEIIQLARVRLDQTRQMYEAKHVSLSQVDEAEGELALAEARGDLVKRAEARLTMATKYLERLEGVHRTGNISDAEYNQAKQRKLEAELDLQHARTAAFPKAEKDSRAAVVTRNFPPHHRLASETSDDLRQILSGKPGHEAKPSADNQELLVTAPPEVMSRVQTFITVTDWPDAITRGSDFQYRNNSVTRAARSFFYACAIEDSIEAFSKQLSLGVLAKLKGDTKSTEFEKYQWGRAAVDPNWEKSLRADWPGKKEAIRRLVREWNRYPLKRLIEDSGVAIGFGVKHFCSVSFEGAPKTSYQITIEPDRTKPRGDDPSYLFSSFPPWWDGDSTKPSDSGPAKSAAVATDPSVAALELSYRQFDQTPHSGWRVLGQDEKRFREAAVLIEAYLRHDELRIDDRVNLHFHAAQCLAFAGDAKSVLDALGHFEQAHYATEPPDWPLRWNDYVSATEAFLKGDLAALKSARERIATGPKLNGVPANLDVVNRLIARFGQPYRRAYSGEPEDAGRTIETPGK